MTKQHAHPLFTIESGVLGYNDRIVLQDFNWQVFAGERWAIVGPNGAGKTTLIRTLIGLLPLQGGQLHFYDTSGRPSTTAPSIGYLPQVNHIDRAFPISVQEVMDSGLYGLKLSKSERRERIASMLDRVGMSSYTDNAIGKLSGGQLQRVLLGRALISAPQLVVLDEPMSFLDKVYKEGFERLLLELTPAESTILMVTHDLPEESRQTWQRLSVGQW